MIIFVEMDEDVYPTLPFGICHFIVMYAFGIVCYLKYFLCSRGHWLWDKLFYSFFVSHSSRSFTLLFCRTLSTAKLGGKLFRYIILWFAIDR